MPGQRMLAELDELEGDLARLAERVESAVAGAVRAVLTGDAAEATRVAAGDDEVDRLENRVTAECRRILTLFQPVAVDHRRVTATLQATADLERIGDLAVGIAERVTALTSLPASPTPANMQEMAGQVLEQVRGAVAAYRDGDARQALRVRQARAVVANLRTGVVRDLVAAMRANPDAVEPGLCLFEVAGHLERIAGHAANLAEGAVFVAEGRDIRHHWDEPSAETSAAVTCGASGR